MLQITRKEEQRFTIGDDITIVVMNARGGTARIGVIAPKEMVVLRDNAIKRDSPKKGATGEPNSILSRLRGMMSLRHWRG